MKKKILIPIISVVVAAVLCGLYVYTKNNKNNKEQQNTNITHGNPPDYYLDPLSGKSFEFYEGMDLSELESETTSDEKWITEENMPEDKQLALTLIKQNPELPSGCETVALTMVLNYYGYTVEKTELADKYLIYSTDNNYVTGFTGSPYNLHGGGCYSPSMSNTANRFLYVNNSDLKARYAVGMEFEKLFVYVANDIPVMVWCTMDMEPARKAGNEKKFKDTTFNWVTNEHCVVLSGYNLKDNSVTIYDSISGIMIYDIEQFKTIYNDMWQMAVVIE